MIFPMIAGWFNDTVMLLFIGLIDTVCYGLLMVAYNIFYAVAQLDLFGGGTAGTLLYENITKRLYMILSVVMVFIFAYQLIMLIIDPDGKSKGAMSQIIKDTLISIILLIVLPLGYRYMAMFQFHVLENGTIPAIIMGTNGASSGNPGKNVAGMVLISFFHPNGTDYNTFFDENGKLKSSANEDCLSATAAMDGEEHPKTCELYIEGLEEWSSDNGWINALTYKRKKLRHWVNDTMSYQIILSSFAALACAYVFFLYAIDIGVRAVKLGVLQLISPIPVILRIFPTTKKSFETWVDHMKKTYLELFIRVAVIFFALEVVKLIPTFIDILFEANDSSTAGGFTKCIATVILIIGVLKFGQEAVPLFKEIFSVGGNLLKDVNLSPKKGVKGRLEDNKALMWGSGKAMAGWGGFKSQFQSQYNKNKAAALEQDGSQHRLASGFMAMGSGLRGIVTGTKNGKSLEHIDLNSSRQARIAGADAANKQFNESKRLQAFSENQAHFLDDINNTGDPNAPRMSKVKKAFKYGKGNLTAIMGAAGEHLEERQFEREQYQNRVSGNYSQTQVTSQALSEILGGLSGVKANTKDKTDKITKKINDIQQKLNTTPPVADPGAFNEARPSQLTMSPEQYASAMEEYNKKLNSYNEKKQKFEEYTALKDSLDAAKAEKNDIIAKELHSDVAKQFAANAFDDVLDKIKKAPVGAFGGSNAHDQQENFNNILSQVTDLRTKASSEAGLTGADIKQLNTIIDNLTNTKIYTGALAEQQKNRSQSFNSSSSSGGSSGGSSGSSGSSGGK